MTASVLLLSFAILQHASVDAAFPAPDPPVENCHCEYLDGQCVGNSGAVPTIKSVDKKREFMDVQSMCTSIGAAFPPQNPTAEDCDRCGGVDECSLAWNRLMRHFYSADIPGIGDLQGMCSPWYPGNSDTECSSACESIVNCALASCVGKKSALPVGYLKHMTPDWTDEASAKAFIDAYLDTSWAQNTFTSTNSIGETTTYFAKGCQAALSNYDHSAARDKAVCNAITFGDGDSAQVFDASTADASKLCSILLMTVGSLALI